MLVNVFDGSWNGGYLVDGGRNLLHGSQNFITGHTDFYSITNTANDKYGKFICSKTDRAWQGPAWDLSTIIKRHNLKVGDTVTYSIMVMVDFVPYKPVSFSVFRNIQSNSVCGSLTMEPNIWYKLSISFTLDEYSLTAIRTRLETNYYKTDSSNYGFEDGYMYFAAPKLELGTVATDWTPAPEDTFEEGTKHPNSIFTNTISVKKKYQYTYGFSNQNSLPAHTIRFMKPDGTWVKAVHVNEDATSGMKSLEIDDDYNIEIMFQNGLTDAQKASFKIMEENFMAIKASNQVSVIDITDGYSVILTNDSYTFLGDTDSVSTTQSTTSQIVAMCGSEIVSCTMGEVTCPNGLSVVSDNKTPSPTLTITATSALTKAGTIDIPIKIGDITIVKKFSFAIAFTGAKGDKGDKGTGVTIKSKAIEYQAGSSGTTAPTGTWQGSIPTVSQGQYLWTRTTVTYSDGNQTVSYSAARQGVNGTSPTVSSSKVQYQQSTSGTTVPTGTWVDAPPAAVAGQYMWSKTTAMYSDGKTAVSYNVTRNGSNGAKGDKGDTGAAGADALALVITSSAGVIFKNTSIATTLTAHVYKGGVEMTGTALTALGTIKWYKDGGTTAVATGQTYTISAGDVENKASFTAQLEG